MAGLKQRYREEIVPRLKEAGGYSNVMEVPRLEKVVVGIGLGEAIQNARAMEAAESELPAIAGQKPIITRAKKSIAAFRLRTGMAIVPPIKTPIAGISRSPVSASASTVTVASAVLPASSTTVPRMKKANGEMSNRTSEVSPSATLSSRLRRTLFCLSLMCRFHIPWGRWSRRKRPSLSE